MVGLMDIYNAFAAGRENRWRREDRAQQEAQRAALQQHLIPAVEGNAEAMAALGQADPNAYFEAQKIRGQQQESQQAAQERQMKMLAQRAQFMLSLPASERPKAWPRVLADAEAAGAVTPGMLPREYTPDLDGGMTELLTTIAPWMEQKEREQKIVAPGGAVWDGEKVVYQAPYAPKAPTLGAIVRVPDGQGGEITMERDPNTGALRPATFEGQPQAQPPQGAIAPPQGGAMNPMQFAAMLERFGGQITSGYRDPAKNKEVGGVANSQHMSGTGIDVVLPPQVKANAIAFAQQNGYEAVDEGDHVHFELPNAPQAAAQPDAPRLGYKPPKPGQRISVNPETGEVTIEQGGAGLTNSTRSGLQKDSIALEEQIARLDGIDAQVVDEYLTYWGAIKGEAGRIADKSGLGGPTAEFAADRRAALQSVRQFFNEYRREITGAAAAVAELAALEQSVLNGKLGPAEFRAALEQNRALARDELMRNQARLGVPTPGRAGDVRQRPQSGNRTRIKL